MIKHPALDGFNDLAESGPGSSRSPLQSKSPEVRTLPIGPSRWGFAWRRRRELSRRGVEEGKVRRQWREGSYDVANRVSNLEAEPICGSILE